MKTFSRIKIRALFYLLINIFVSRDSNTPNKNFNIFFSKFPDLNMNLKEDDGNALIQSPCEDLETVELTSRWSGKRQQKRKANPKANITAYENGHYQYLADSSFCSFLLEDFQAEDLF